jgi:hypothetical protein
LKQLSRPQCCLRLRQIDCKKTLPTSDSRATSRTFSEYIGQPTTQRKNDHRANCFFTSKELLFASTVGTSVHSVPALKFGDTLDVIALGGCSQCKFTDRIRAVSTLCCPRVNHNVHELGSRAIPAHRVVALSDLCMSATRFVRGLRSFQMRPCFRRVIVWLSSVTVIATYLSRSQHRGAEQVRRLQQPSVPRQHRLHHSHPIREHAMAKASQGPHNCVIVMAVSIMSNSASKTASTLSITAATAALNYTQPPSKVPPQFNRYSSGLAPSAALSAPV